MVKLYLVKSTYYGYYSTGFQCVEVVSESEYKKLQQIKEEKFSFDVDEWEGKHSETRITIDDNDFVLVTDDEETIELFQQLFGRYIGTFSFADYVIERYDKMNCCEDVKMEEDKC